MRFLVAAMVLLSIAFIACGEQVASVNADGGPVNPDGGDNPPVSG